MSQKPYEKPEIDVIKLNCEDIIVTSGGVDEPIVLPEDDLSLNQVKLYAKEVWFSDCLFTDLPDCNCCFYLL